jgi:riboflavin transporter FmnP
MSKKWSVQKLVLTAMLAAVAGVLMSLEFSVPMMPAFYKVDFSDVPSVIALFVMGPASAACVEAIKILIKLITVGTSTMYVGEFANLLGIALFVLPIWLVYKKGGCTVKSGAVALTVTLPIRIAFSCFLNACITLPLYAKAMGMSLNEVVAIVGSVNPYIQNLPTFLILATVPFNLLKLTLNYVAGYLLYTSLRSAKVLNTPQVQ